MSPVGGDVAARRPFVGVGLFVLDADGRFILMRRRGSHGAGTWGLPGGHLEFGQSPAEAAAREAGEELDLAFDPGDVTMAGVHTNDVFADEGRHYVTLYGVAVLKTGTTPRIMEPHKCDRLGWFSAGDLPEPLFLPLRNLLSMGFRPDRP